MTYQVKDLYALLGVRRDAAPAEIKAGYLRATAENESGRQGNERALHELELDMAYHTLSEAESRGLYDRALEGDRDSLDIAPAGWFDRTAPTITSAGAQAPARPKPPDGGGQTGCVVESGGQDVVHPWNWEHPVSEAPKPRRKTRTEKLSDDGHAYITLGVVVGVVLVPVAAWFASGSSWGFMGMTLVGLLFVGVLGHGAHNRFTEYVIAKEKEWSLRQAPPSSP